MDYKFTSNQKGHRSLSEEEFSSTQIRKRHFVVASILDSNNPTVKNESEGKNTFDSPEVNKED